MVNGIFSRSVTSFCFGFGALFLLSFVGQLRAQELFPKVRPLLDDSCLACHDGTEENGLDFNQLGKDLSDDATFRKWERIYDRVEKGEMPPESESRPSKKLTDQALAAISNALTEENDKFRRQNGRVILRRLTRTEYQHTLNDLLTIKAEVGDIIPAENSSTSFDTVFSSQGFSPLHAKSYLEAAEVALDTAIQLGKKPDSKTRRYESLESEHVKKHIKEEGHVIVGQLDDAIVMFSNASYIYKLDDHVPSSGFYKFRAKARGHQTEKAVVLTLNAGHYNRGFTEMLGYFDLDPEKSGVFEVEAFFERNQYLFPGVEDLEQPGGKNIWNLGPEKYEGAGVALEWMELEGPIIDEWPPYSTTNLLKDVELKKLKDKRWDPRRGEHIQYEVVQGKNPKKQFERVVGWLAPRAFRRPLLEGEGTPFVKLGLNAFESGRSFDDSLRVALRAILTSPNFLFMTAESGELDDFSLASRLSYFLWKTMPDDKLFLAAKRKRLLDPEQRKLEVERMLSDKKASRFVEDFVNQWLQLSEIDATAPDKRLYPEYDELLKRSMLEETESFIAHLIEKDLGVENLIDSDFAFLNRRLAEHYEIDDVEGQKFRKVKLPKKSPRGGILTHASILKVTANGTTTSPVLRGSWVLTHLLGTPPSPPPPTIGSIEPDTRGTTTIREMLEKHRNDTSCSSCHKQIDPPGFALECFDVIGGYRERFRNKENGDRVKKQLLGRSIWEYKNGLPVDASGELPNGKKFDGIGEYKRLLKSQEEQIARNLISQLVVYSTGAEIQFADRAKVEEIVERCRESNFGLRTMIHEVIGSELFLNK